MNGRVIENFMVSLGFKADTAELDDTLTKMRELAALADSLERLKALGVRVSVTMDAKGDGGTVFGPN